MHKANYIKSYKKADLFILVSFCSLIWFFISNAIGLVLSILLIEPKITLILFKLSYGKWVPLHLNFHLYGWCSVPLIGILFKIYNSNSKESILEKLNLLIWSFALLCGGISWLIGGSSGKIFLEWTSLPKFIFVGNLFFLWSTLFFLYIKNNQLNDLYQDSIFKKFYKIVLLVVLFLVPIAFLFVLRPNIFPSINVDSSGATGVSLLLSSLVVVAILIYVPLVLFRLKKKNIIFSLTAILLIHILLSLFLNQGNSSHHDLEQIIGLSSVVVWVPILINYYRKFEWNAELKLWFVSFLIWGVLLVLTAVVMFLPGILDYVKFTNIIVAHVHIAMAGMITSFLMIVLYSLMSLEDANFILNKKNYILWQLGLVVQILSLLLLGLIEINYYGIGYVSKYFTLVEVLRAIGGLFMLLASYRWLKANYKLINV